MPVIISLAPYELHLAAEIGLIRNTSSTLRKSQDVVFTKGWLDSLKGHIAGATGELAVAKWLGVYYNGSYNTWKKNPDISSKLDIEVRHRINHEHDLIVRHTDLDDSVYVLTTGDGPEIYIRGWILGHRAKNKRFLANHGRYLESFFIPEAHLNPPEELLKFK